MKNFLIKLILVFLVTFSLLANSEDCQINDSVITLESEESYSIEANIPERVWGEAYLWATKDNKRWNYSFTDSVWTDISGREPLVSSWDSYKGKYELTTITNNNITKGVYEIKAIVWDGWNIVDPYPYECNYTFILR